MKVAVLLLLGAGLLKGQEAPSFANLSSGEILSRAFSGVGGDLKALTLAPFEHPKATGLFAGSALLLVAFDRPLTEGWQKQVESRVDYHIQGLWEGRESLGGADSWILAALPVWYFGSLATGSSRGQVAAVLGVKAGAYAYLVSHVALKSLFARQRPNPTLGVMPAVAPKTDSPWAWGRYHRPYMGSESDGTGFPSFHTTLYASIASVFAEVYGHPWIPYGIAAVLFGADIKGHHHWVSDMAAGAAIGVGIGHVVVREFRGVSSSRRGAVAWSLQPWADPRGSAGVAVRAVW